MSFKSTCVNALEWSENGLNILDQRLLPETITYNRYQNAPSVADAIKTMQVRGAPAIGIAAAYGVALSVQQHFSNHSTDWQTQVLNDIELLAQSRPTAVNLFWALELMRSVVLKNPTNLIPEVIALAEKIHREDIEANYKMGEAGADIIGTSAGILTHCNAGALATGGYGTALGVIRSVCQRQSTPIYAGETRPWSQGTRLTVWELAQDNVSTTLIADSASAWLMASKAVDWLVVGADRVAANGDVANKIGTYSLAVLARQHGVKMMVVAPTSTVDFSTPTGAEIEIEQRQQNELLPTCYQDNPSVKAWNPVFDVTPAELIDAIVTEQGCVFNPTSSGMRSLIC